MKPDKLTWFDGIATPVSAFTADGYTYALASSGGQLRVWITQPGESQPSRLVRLFAGGRVIRAELGPIPGEGGPRRLSADESEAWQRAHKVYAAAPWYVPARGEELRAYWQEQADRAWAAIQRQFTK
jgi:hypothetical protein